MKLVFEYLGIGIFAFGAGVGFEIVIQWIINGRSKKTQR